MLITTAFLSTNLLRDLLRVALNSLRFIAYRIFKNRLTEPFARSIEVC